MRELTKRTTESDKKRTFANNSEQKAIVARVRKRRIHRAFAHRTSFHFHFNFYFVILSFSFTFCVFLYREALAPVLDNKSIQVNGQIRSINCLKHLYYILHVLVFLVVSFLPSFSIMLDSLYYYDEYNYLPFTTYIGQVLTDWLTHLRFFRPLRLALNEITRLAGKE